MILKEKFEFYKGTSVFKRTWYYLMVFAPVHPTLTLPRNISLLMPSRPQQLMAAIAKCEVGIEGSKYFPPGSDLIWKDIKDLFKYLHSASLNLYWNTIARFTWMDPAEKITIASCVGHCASNTKLDNHGVNLLLHIKWTLQLCLKMIFIEFMVTTSIAY